jgi:tetratricopeptide (TPR) repeat protein
MNKRKYFKFLIVFPVFFFLLFTGVKVNGQQNCDCPEFKKIKKEVKFDNTQTISDESMSQLLSSPNFICRVKAYEIIANRFMDKNQYDSARYNLIKEEEMCRKSGCADSVFIRCNFNWYYYYYKQGKYKEALEYQFRNLEITKKAGNYYEHAFCYLDIGRVFEMQQQAEKGMEYVRLAIPDIDKVKDPYLKAEACYNLSHRYIFYSNHNSAPGILDTVVKYANLAIDLGRLSGNLSAVNNGFYQLAGIAYIKKDYRESLRLNDSSLLISKSSDNYNMIATNYVDMSDTYGDMGNLGEAKRMADSSLYYAKLYNQPESIIDAYEMLEEIAEKSNDYKAALEAFKNVKTIQDSLLTSENTKAINELEQKYNKSQNEASIKDLSKQKQLYLLLALAGLLAGVGLIFFIRQQSLKNKQKILETEQRLNRARMNPHFFFNALASMQGFALRENDGKALAGNLSKFSHIMRETLESSYKDYVTIEQEIDFLNEYLDLQKMRFPQKFSYKINTAAGLEPHELLIPSMILQPFAENSIEHGFQDIDYPGMLQIDFSKEGTEIRIAVSDNGTGFGGVQKNPEGHISRASQIIKDRIYLLNIKLKTKARFSIDNNPSGKGILVQIFLPVILKNESADNR